MKTSLILVAMGLLVWFIFQLSAPVALIIIFGAIAVTGRGQSD